MRCEICGELGGEHATRCPKYKENENQNKCVVCGEYINDGDDYIQNDYGEYIHYGCERSMRWLLDWLGYGVKRNGG